MLNSKVEFNYSTIQLLAEGEGEGFGVYTEGAGASEGEGVAVHTEEAARVWVRALLCTQRTQPGSVSFFAFLCAVST